MEPFGSKKEIKNRTRPKIRKTCQSLWIFSPRVNLFIDCYWAVLYIRGRRLTLCVCFFRLERFMLQLSLSESLQLEELLSSFSFLFSPLESNGTVSTLIFPKSKESLASILLFCLNAFTREVSIVLAIRRYS